MKLKNNKNYIIEKINLKDEEIGFDEDDFFKEMNSEEDAEEELDASFGNSNLKTDKEKGEAIVANLRSKLGNNITFKAFLDENYKQSIKDVEEDLIVPRLEYGLISAFDDVFKSRLRGYFIRPYGQNKTYPLLAHNNAKLQLHAYLADNHKDISIDELYKLSETFTANVKIIINWEWVKELVTIRKTGNKTSTGAYEFKYTPLEYALAKKKKRPEDLTLGELIEESYITKMKRFDLIDKIQVDYCNGSDIIFSLFFTPAESYFILNCIKGEIYKQPGKRIERNDGDRYILEAERKRAEAEAKRKEVEEERLGEEERLNKEIDRQIEEVEPTNNSADEWDDFYAEMNSTPEEEY